MKGIKFGSVIEVIWDDATADSSWTTNEESDWPDMRCVTVGYFVKENDRAIMLMDSMFEDADKKDGTVGGMKTIPKGMIVGVRVLRVARTIAAACKLDARTHDPFRRAAEE